MLVKYHQNYYRQILSEEFSLLRIVFLILSIDVVNYETSFARDILVAGYRMLIRDSHRYTEFTQTVRGVIQEAIEIS